MKILNIILSLSLLAITTCFSQTSTTIFLVRHAEQDMTITNDPPLTAEGQARAELLRDMLSKTTISGAYATTYTRGAATALPTAKANNIQITNYKLEDDEEKLVASIWQQYKGKNVLFIGHSTNIVEILNAAVKAKIYNEKAIDKFSDFYVITFSGDTPGVVTRLKYGK